MKIIVATAMFLSIVYGCSESDPPSPTAATIDSQVIDTSLFNEKTAFLPLREIFLSSNVSNSSSFSTSWNTSLLLIVFAS